MSAAALEMAPLETFDDSSIRSYLAQLKSAATDTAGNFLRSAIEKVRGVLDVHARTVHVDTSVGISKQRFLQLHETGHAEIPHQSGLYRFVQDCLKTLSSDVADLFEREANTFATIVLFQDGAFTRMTEDERFSINVPLNAGRKFGSSKYAAMREYVRHHRCACIVLVLEPTVFTVGGHTAEVRRVEMSASFQKQFPVPHVGVLRHSDPLIRFVPLTSVMSRPRPIRIQDRNAAWHDFIGEGFKTKYNTFVLLHSEESLDRSGWLIAPPSLFAVTR